MAKKDGYGAEAIQVLKGLEGVRKRPGMYIGDTDDGTGLHHMVFEVLDNAIDEIQAGHATRAVVTMGEDWASVEDNGRGIPVDKHPTEKVSALQVVMTILHAGGKFDQENSGPSGGLHGVGVSVVNALSSKLVATVWRDGGIYEQEYSQGIPKDKVKQIGEAKVKHGTRVTFWPDPTVFRDVKFKPSIITARMEEMAYLKPGCTLVLRADVDADAENVGALIRSSLLTIPGKLAPQLSGRTLETAVVEQLLADEIESVLLHLYESRYSKGTQKP